MSVHVGHAPTLGDFVGYDPPKGAFIHGYPYWPREEPERMSKKVKKSTKVFCSNCRHFKAGYSHVEYEYCDVSQSPGTQATYYSRRVAIPAPEPKEKNANNDCKDYKEAR